MSEKKFETTDYDKLEKQKLRESIRPRHPCTGSLRRPLECGCGRQRALIRHGRRWERLTACHRCLGSAISANPSVGSGSCKAVANA